MDAAPITLAELAPQPLWVAWQTQERDPGKPPTKVPYAPRNGHQARADDPRTWGTRAAAEARAGRLPKPFGIGGVGIEFGELADGICLGGVDFDSCMNAEGVLEPWAVEVLERLDSYAEVSPSRTGCKAFFTYIAGDLAALRSAMGTQHGKQFKRGGGEHPPAIELHISNRYFAVTDQHLAGTPAELRPVSLTTLLWLIREAGPAFAGKAAAVGNGHDVSRSAVAFRKGVMQRRAGMTFEEMCAALAADAETRDWVADKGHANGARELRRIWDAGKDETADSAREMLEHPDMSVLRLNRRAAPVLDLMVFGPRLAKWISTTATASACPPDYVAAPLLSIASVLIGNARWALAWDGWVEPPHLWACSVGDSGGGKSPGGDVLLRDVVPTLERRMNADHPERLRAWVSASEIDKAARERWEGDVRTAYKEGKPPPLPPEATAPQKPETPRLRQNDVTIEKVATLLATAAPKGLMIHRDELLGWVAGMNAYHDAGRAFWIESYGGRPYRMERQKNPEPIDVPHLAVAAFGGTQPAKIAALLKDPDDGLLSRIFWFWPEPVPFAKGKAAPDVAWAIETLDHLRRLELSPATPDIPACPVFVPLHETLHDDMVAFGQEMQARQQEAGGLMQSAYGKARGLVLRLSLVLTYLQWVAERPDAPPPARITPAGFTAAAHLVADYLMPMAARLYGDAATSREDRDAATLARWIMKTRPREVHVRTMQRSERLPGLSTAAGVHAAAEVLVEAGWLVPPKPGAFQQPARAAYPVNSRIFEVTT